MRGSLAVICLCFQLALTTVAQPPPQQPAPWPPPIPNAPSRPKPVTQKPPQPSQPKPDDDLDIVKISTNLVQIDAIVTDEKGKPITDLRSDEIEVFEDGKARNVSNFSYITLSAKSAYSTEKSKATESSIPVPSLPLRPHQARRTMAFVVDDLGMSFDSFYYVRRSLKKFVDEQLAPDDLVAIIRTGSGIGALQQFTTDKRQLYAAIEKVKWNPHSRAVSSTLSPFGAGGRIAGPNSQMSDPSRVNIEDFREEIFTVGTLGALSYVIRGLKQQPGRKSVVLFSDGFGMTNDNTVMTRLRRLTDQANRSSVVVYTVHAPGLQTLNLNAADHITFVDSKQSGNGAIAVEKMLRANRNSVFDSQIGLDYLASRTGGLSFKNANDLSESVRRMLADQEGYYLIGYRPDDSTFQQINGSAKFHEVSLKVKRPGKYKVRMRNGFYGVSDEAIAAVPQPPQNQMVAALVSPFGSSAIQLKLTSLFVNDLKVGNAMLSFLHVNAKDLDFTEEPDGMHKAELEVMALTVGDNGQVIDQFSYLQTIRIRKENFERGLKNGLTYNATIPIKESGAYQFRIALRDRSSGRIGSASQFIEVPDIKKDRLVVSGIVMKGMTLDYYLGRNNVNGDTEKPEALKADTLPNASPAVRQFRNGMALAYGFNIYNAQLDKSTGKPNLKVQVRVFRNGAELFTGEETPYDANGQVDPRRFVVNGGLQLGNNMTPGEYVLQVIVTDSVKDKLRLASQWLDFEIVK